MLRLQRRQSTTSIQPLSNQERRFGFGTRSLADLLAPAAVEVTRDHLRLEYQYARVLVVVGYPRTVTWSIDTGDSEGHDSSTGALLRRYRRLRER